MWVACRGNFHKLDGMKVDWRYLKSFVNETVLERTSSPYNEELEVWYAFGKKVLNAKSVNYSFGLIDKVFRSALAQLKFERREVKDVLILGLGVGNMVAVLSEYDPEMRFIGVEIDAEVIRLGRKYFELDSYPNLEIVEADAIAYVADCYQKFDLVIVDLFVDATVPPQAEEAAFFARLDLLLRKPGLLLWNRLALSDEIRQHTDNFTRKMQQALPGTKSLSAHKNRVLCYEK